MTRSQSASKHAKSLDDDACGRDSAGAAAAEATSASDTCVRARVQLVDCTSLIYDCGVALLSIAHEECKCFPVAVSNGACKAILKSWRSDFYHSQLREGINRYAEEFNVMMELMVSRIDDGICNVHVSGSDIVAIGYVAAAVGRRSCTPSVANDDRHTLICAVLTTFFRALHLCDSSNDSLGVLKDASAR